jgi:membrane protease YdiL (CAAX protease family)
LYKGLRNKFSFPVAAVATSLLFALGHLQFGSGAPLLWVAGLDTFVLSVVLCYLREKTGSLWPGIMIHAAKNAVAFSVLFLFK